MASEEQGPGLGTWTLGAPTVSSSSWAVVRTVPAQSLQRPLTSLRSLVCDPRPHFCAAGGENHRKMPK